MPNSHLFTLPLIGAMAATAVLAGGHAAAKSGIQAIYQTTNGGDHLIGTFPNADGTVFVITDVGPNGRGQILLLTPSGKTYTHSLVKAFACNSDSDGAEPSGELAADAAGNVWGMTQDCGAGDSRQGTIFELVKPQSGGNWTFRTAAQMPSSIGQEQIAGSGYGRVAFDDAGNLYGLATLGCDETNGCGKIFKAPAELLDGTKPKTKIKIIYNFPNIPGSQPHGLVRDKKGNLFGVEYSGGAHNLGEIWEVSPSGKGAWVAADLYDFCQLDKCDDGYAPNGIPALDNKGNLYGTGMSGGSNTGHGVTWVMTPPKTSGDWVYRVLHVLNDPTGQCMATTDFGVTNPFQDTILNKQGQVLSFVLNGGYFAPCTNDQTNIYGGLMSFDPVSGADAIVSNQFAVPHHVSGPYTIISSPTRNGNTIFGSSQWYYDESTDTYEPGVVFKITP